MNCGISQCIPLSLLRRFVLPSPRAHTALLRLQRLLRSCGAHALMRYCACCAAALPLYCACCAAALPRYCACCANGLSASAPVPVSRRGALEAMDPMFWASKLHFHLTGIEFYNFPCAPGRPTSVGSPLPACVTGIACTHLHSAWSARSHPHHHRLALLVCSMRSPSAHSRPPGVGGSSVGSSSCLQQGRRRLGAECAAELRLDL